MKYKEYLETATTERKNELLTDEEIRKLFTTPLGELDKKYRNLLECPNFLTEEDSIKHFYNNHSIQEYVTRYIYISEDYEYLDGEDFVIPLFVYRDSDNTPCGFIVYLKDDEYSDRIKNIVLFSFDVNDKSFGRQIWIDFEKDLAEKIKEYKTITWFAKETNTATKKYDSIIERFNGSKSLAYEGILKYQIGGDV